jgi:hypothetical protein
MQDQGEKSSVRAIGVMRQGGLAGRRRRDWLRLMTKGRPHWLKAVE